MRVYCGFESPAVTGSVKKVITTLADTQIVSQKEFAEVVITNQEDGIGDSSKNFVLATFSGLNLKIVPDNVVVIKQPIQLPEMFTALEGFRKKVDIGKKKVLIFNPHHHWNIVINKRDLEQRLYGVSQRVDVDYQIIRDFEQFCELVKSGKQYDLILIDPFPTETSFNKEDAKKVNAIISNIKSLPNPPVILVEECEGHEQNALQAGADGILRYWEPEIIVKAINQCIPKTTGQEVKKLKPEDLIGGKVMKILVVDDNPKHQASARETLVGHDVTIVANFHQAQKALSVGPDFDVAQRIEKEQGVEWEEACKLASPKIDFDVVLSDLLMPKGSIDVMGPKGQKFIYDEMAYGYPIAILAAKSRVPLIAVVSDTNHHDHPMAYTFDLLGGGWDMYDNEIDFVINGSKVMFRHCPGFTKDGGKRWDKVLANLLGQEMKEEMPAGGVM